MPKEPGRENTTDWSRGWFLFRAIGGALFILALVWLISKIFPGLDREAIAFGFAVMLALLYAFRVRLRKPHL
jgi:hypothetical protein